MTRVKEMTILHLIGKCVCVCVCVYVCVCVLHKIMDNKIEMFFLQMVNNIFIGEKHTQHNDDDDAYTKYY